MELVGTDLGGENVDVWHHMIQLHGGDEKCVITGSSVHNQRIERLWQDVHRSVLMPFKELFIRLEVEELLDVTNEVDMYCLHEVYQDINQCLSEFIRTWNNHSLSSEHGQSPSQLFVASYYDDQSSASEEESNLTSTAVGHDSLLHMASEAVEVSNLRYCPCDVIRTDIRLISQHMTLGNGYSVYRRAAELLGQHLTAGCDNCVYV